ncbi:MAG: hypothetical protein LBU90_03730 [Bacteroidales bacterium]|jgi:hypothetical protein|nr:hypothetical protein [Bacteroidales bacterium]
MSKKIIIGIAVVLVIVLVFVFAGKSNAAETSENKDSTGTGSNSATASVASKWDLTNGLWTLAQRESCLREVKKRISYLNPDGPWYNWGYTSYEDAVLTAIYQTHLSYINGSSVYAFTVDKNYSNFLWDNKENGVYHAALTAAPTILKSSSVKRK